MFWRIFFPYNLITYNSKVVHKFYISTMLLLIVTRRVRIDVTSSHKNKLKCCIDYGYLSCNLKWTKAYVPCITHFVASFRMHQSCPMILFLLVSHPSIHLPNSVYLSGMKMGFVSASILSQEAKKSSVAKATLPPACKENHKLFRYFTFY